MQPVYYIYNKVCFAAACIMVIGSLLFSSCSTTSGVPEDDKLFTGLTKIDYQDYDRNQNFITTQEEVEAALATAPNGALFGSSYYRTPFPYGLWIWNAFADKEDGFSKWMTSTFGKQPVLMSWVNPALRASVAQSVLRNHGYFRGSVSYDTIPQRNPKKMKIGYTLKMNHLFTIDSISYEHFPATADSLIRETLGDARIHPGDPFTVEALDAERARLSNLFRNNGYYYYQQSFSSYLADTLAVPGKAQLRLQAIDNLPEEARHKWYIGNVTVDLRKQFMQQLNDSLGRGFFKVRFSGSRPPVRLGVVMGDMKLRHGQPFSNDKYLESVSKINGKGIFSMVDFSFTPRDTTSLCDTLDLALNCVLDKPYDSYIETNLKNKTSGRIGPELVLGFTKRNAFRGGELLDINLHGSYEWQRSGGASGTKRLNTYEYGVDASVEFPRLVLPWREWFARRSQNRQQNVRRRMRTYYSSPSTIAKLSRTTLNRPDYFKMVNFSAEWTYRWSKTATSRHELSPLTITYQHLVHTTNYFDSILTSNPYLKATMQNVFIPKMRYTYAYKSPSSMKNPITWETSLSQSGNISSLLFMATGKKWSEQGKEMFKNPYSQFVKVETDFTKLWRLTNLSQLVGHVSAGVIYSYGNSKEAPFCESFYVGGANSIRAFPMRSIGPGKFEGTDDPAYSYLLQNGDVKFLSNLEYRTRLFGSLYGAVFLDAGNVWKIGRSYGDESIDALFADSSFKPGKFLSQVAVGTGVGFRYDLDFLVLRVDWGIGLHVPYNTGKSGFYNIRRFKDGQALHLAVGYPF
ncbi:MAG: BamA/TamA family outer membrane protein [Prevotella sp.]|nr:BamA/TamA family outer membrane protein [Prevotella sp.]